MQIYKNTFSSEYSDGLSFNISVTKTYREYKGLECMTIPFMN